MQQFLLQSDEKKTPKKRERETTANNETHYAHE